MKSLLKAAAAAAMGMLMATSAQAITLTGDTVTATIETTYSAPSSETGIVGAGADLSFFLGSISLDFNSGPDGDIFTMSSSANFCGMFGCGDDPYFNEIVTLTLTGLDFDLPLSAVDILTSIGGALVSFTSDSVIFTWNEAPISQGTFLSAQFVSEPDVDTSPVPLPAALPLLLAGLGGLGALGLRRKSA